MVAVRGPASSAQPFLPSVSHTRYPIHSRSEGALRAEAFEWFARLSATGRPRQPVQLDSGANIPWGPVHAASIGIRTAASSPLFA